MRRTKRASKKRSQLAQEAQDTETRIERLYQDAARDFVQRLIA